MSDGSAAIGTTLERDDGAAGWLEIAEVTNIGGPQLSADTAEVTNHASPGGWEEFVATVLRTGNVSLDLNFDPDGASHQQLIKDLINRTKANYRLTFPDATVWEFECLVTGYEPTSDHSDKLTGSATLKPTGQPTLDVSAATV